MVSRYEGRDDCALVVDGDFITVEHRRGRAPDLRVHRSRVTAVHYERATRFVSGIITIAVDGAPLAVPTGTSVGSDPNTVVFKQKANDTFESVQAWLRDLAHQNSARSVTPPPKKSG